MLKIQMEIFIKQLNSIIIHKKAFVSHKLGLEWLWNARIICQIISRDNKEIPYSSFFFLFFPLAYYLFLEHWWIDCQEGLQVDNPIIYFVLLIYEASKWSYFKWIQRLTENAIRKRKEKQVKNKVSKSNDVSLASSLLWRGRYAVISWYIRIFNKTNQTKKKQEISNLVIPKNWQNLRTT